MGRRSCLLGFSGAMVLPRMWLGTQTELSPNFLTGLAGGPASAGYGGAEGRSSPVCTVTINLMINVKDVGRRFGTELPTNWQPASAALHCMVRALGPGVRTIKDWMSPESLCLLLSLGPGLLGAQV